jgi:hypothetical protein
MLSFKTGGWVIALAVIVSVALGARILIPALRSGRGPLVGDKKNIETYGFDLSNLQVDRARLVAGNMVKDAIRPLDRPGSLTPAEVLQRNEAQRGKYLVPTDWVLGLTLNGESRAYPLRVLNWHEIVNDTLGGTPLAVTFNPLSFTAAAFLRADGEDEWSFGVSGLLYNSTLVMYDRREDSLGESLWLPLTGRAIAGPAAGTGLEPLPCSLVTWSNWVTRHPDTTVIDGDPDFRKHYGMEPYSSYYQRGMLRFPVSPPVPEDGPDAMTRTLAYRTRDRLTCIPLQEGREPELPDGLAGLELHPVPDGMEVWVPQGGVAGDLLYTFWFACHAEHQGRSAR